MAPITVPIAKVGMSKILAIASTGLDIYGSYQQGQAAKQQGENQQILSDYNAKVAEQRAKSDELRSGFNQMMAVKQADKDKSRAIAEMGAAGASGSPVTVDNILKNAANAELDMLLTGFEGMTSAARNRSQADLDRLQGRISAQGGRNTSRGYGIQAGMKGFSFLSGLFNKV